MWKNYFILRLKIRISFFIVRKDENKYQKIMINMINYVIEADLNMLI